MLCDQVVVVTLLAVTSLAEASLASRPSSQRTRWALSSKNMYQDNYTCGWASKHKLNNQDTPTHPKTVIVRTLQWGIWMNPRLVGLLLGWSGCHAVQRQPDGCTVDLSYDSCQSISYEIANSPHPPWNWARNGSCNGSQPSHHGSSGWGIAINI